MLPRLLLLALGLLGIWTAPARSEAVPVTRQILVMVRQPPDHYRAGGAYGGGYGDELGRSARGHIAEAVARRYGLTVAGDWPMPMIGVDCFVMNVPDSRSASAAAAQVSRDGAVSWAQPVSLYTTRGSAPNDPLFAAEPAAVKWHLADLHAVANGRGTRVAVIDSGIDANHPDLAGQLAVNRNFVGGQKMVAEQHGTAVAGIIAAKADNRLGVAGVAPGARLLGLRACWQQRGSTACDSLSLAKALYFAVENRADVINLSLGGPDDRLLATLIGAALGRHIAVVGAYDPKRPDGGFPASLAGVIPVSDGLARPRAGVYIAPGRDVPTTEPGGRWFLVNGSSFAAAHVSGLLALMRQKSRSATLVAARRDGGPVDACASLIRAAGACDCACGPIRSAASR